MWDLKQLWKKQSLSSSEVSNESSAESASDPASDPTSTSTLDTAMDSVSDPDQDPDHKPKYHTVWPSFGIRNRQSSRSRLGLRSGSLGTPKLRRRRVEVDAISHPTPFFDYTPCSLPGLVSLASPVKGSQILSPEARSYIEVLVDSKVEAAVNSYRLVPKDSKNSEDFKNRKNSTDEDHKDTDSDLTYFDNDATSLSNKQIETNLAVAVSLDSKGVESGKAHLVDLDSTPNMDEVSNDMASDTDEPNKSSHESKQDTNPFENPLYVQDIAVLEKTLRVKMDVASRRYSVPVWLDSSEYLSRPEIPTVTAKGDKPLAALPA